MEVGVVGGWLGGWVRVSGHYWEGEREGRGLFPRALVSDHACLIALSEMYGCCAALCASVGVR